MREGGTAPYSMFNSFLEWTSILGNKKIALSNHPICITSHSQYNIKIKVIYNLWPLTHQFTGQRIIRQLREMLFKSVVAQEIGFFDKTSTGELINRLSTDTSKIGQSLTSNISDGLRSMVQVIGGFGMMVSPLYCDLLNLFSHILCFSQTLSRIVIRKGLLLLLLFLWLVWMVLSFNFECSSLDHLCTNDLIVFHFHKLCCLAGT